jgi:acetate kinase
MTECIAVVNAGSSSIKFALFENGLDERFLFGGQIEQIGVSPRLTVKDSKGEKLLENEWSATELDHRSATRVILETAISLSGGNPIIAVGHRVVHGGTDFTEPVLVTTNVVASLKELCPLAPLHQPHNLVAIEAIAAAAPHLPQVACFDTAFHQAQPPIAQTFALPRELTESGIRRYGFHGLSYEYVSAHLRTVSPEDAGKRIVIAHLGNGASLCAIYQSRSIATTMGFTAVEGLIMGTRCGSIDPGVLLYLMDEHKMDARALENMMYKKSGLLGVSGISGDMRLLRASKEPRAREAIDLFIYRIVREIGSLAAALGGLDGLVFTGGIGQHDAATRKEVVAGCAWLGAALDERANEDHEEEIEGISSRMRIWVLPTDEERVIARHTASLIDDGAGAVAVS